MSTSGGSRAIIAALLANLGIALTKLIAWAFSGATALLAEAVHSFADSINQILLLAGGKRSRREATSRHPFGYGRERFIYAFVVSIILFSVGGLFSIYEGIDKLSHPHPLEVWWLPMVVLSVAIVLESFSLRTAVKESNVVRGKSSWIAFVRHAKAPELPVVLLEDLAALVGLVFAFLGVGLTVLTGNPLWDAVGTIAIGGLLVLVAIILGIETKSLLIGEGVSAEKFDTITSAILDGSEAERIVHLKTLYLGPDEVLVAGKVAFAGSLSLKTVATHIDTIERRIRDTVPEARVIYIEPDIDREPSHKQDSADANRSARNVSTDAIVIKGLD